MLYQISDVMFDNRITLFEAKYTVTCAAFPQCGTDVDSCTCIRFLISSLKAFTQCVLHVHIYMPQEYIYIHVYTFVCAATAKRAEDLEGGLYVE